MKNIYILLLSSLFISSAAIAGEGDTIHVQSHQETHWDWNGSWYDTTALPETGSYRKILMYYTLGCPSIGCSEWDYTTKIEVEDEVNDSTTRWVELTRIITPYAGDKNSTWKHTWVIDVTDYAPVLTGERRIRAHYGGWQDGFTVSIAFDFIEGTPPREVLEVNTIYDGTFRYGFANDPIEGHLTDIDIRANAKVESAKFRMVASGHSFGGNENCAEFCRKWFKLYVNGFESHQQYVWRDDCGSNVLEDQTGTWIYNRAGWCPGDVTTPYDREVGAFLTQGQESTFNVDWQSYNYQGGAGFDPQYIIESTLFQYGPWSFNNDMELTQVISPSLQDRQMQVNPICNNPKVLVTNTGAQNITRAKIKYWVEGSKDVFEHEWFGVMKPGDSTTITLPSTDRWLFGGKTKNLFHAEITSVNGVEDDYASNNTITSRFDDSQIFPEDFIIVFDNNNSLNETQYQVVNDRGDVVYERTSSAVNGLYYDTLSLDSGCYTMYVKDKDCDGLSFFANNDGNGRIWLHPADEDDFFPAFHMFESGFGCESEISFTVGWSQGDPETSGYPLGEESYNYNFELTAFPNPAQDRVTLMITGEKELGGTLRIYNKTGQLVQEEVLMNVNGTQVTDLPAGQYFAQYQSEHALKTASFLIVR